ncbi:ROK family protein [Sphingobacterium sp. UT-1RO-CII-1]|uniref:ROK family protein n=1 Tax=Sphingobacterium sp. UT-1RO-CII-1 TaxID=2995225 RepID=UPI00227B8983|nr:ROK family protein [Sphingobacterium sp. UT-1RO-CII-1]MCY4779637.1 ROK family protein [Sphingobacterium sp. UT-1RO-CII-1]
MKQAIVKSFYLGGTQSIADLARNIGKSIPSVTRAIQELVTSKVLNEEGYAPSTGGRRAIQFKLNAKYNPHFIAVAIDQYSIHTALFDINNTAVIPPIMRDNRLNSPEAFQSIINAIQNILDHPDCDKSRIGAIGITIPGFVDSHLQINDSFRIDDPLYNLPASLKKIFDIPIFIENDSSAIAIAESTFGAARNTPNALIINFNWGVGLGIIVENKLFKGHNGFAGEFSHIPLSQFNKLCSCGKRGCLEVEASLITAIDYVENKIQEGESSILSTEVNKEILHTGNALIKAAFRGDPLAINAINKSAYMLGKGIATLIHILNPEKIIISGRGSELGDIIFPQIQSAVHEFAIPRLAAQTEIKISQLPHDIQLLGSMCSVIDKYNWN